jgi:hypothetical protein
MDEPTIPEFFIGYEHAFLNKMGINLKYQHLNKNFPSPQPGFKEGIIFRERYNYMIDSIKVMVDEFLSRFAHKDCLKHLTRDILNKLYLDYVEEYKEYYLKIYNIYYAFGPQILELNSEKLEVKGLIYNLLDEISCLKESQTNRLMELEKENQELKSIVYNLLDQVSSIKENKPFLLDRIKELEKGEVKQTEEIVPDIPAQESASRKPVQTSLDDLDDYEEPIKNNPLLAAERRGQIKRGGTVANAVNSFKKNFYELKDDARQAQMVRDWQN